MLASEDTREKSSIVLSTVTSCWLSVWCFKIRVKTVAKKLQIKQPMLCCNPQRGWLQKLRFTHFVWVNYVSTRCIGWSENVFWPCIASLDLQPVSRLSKVGFQHVNGKTSTCVRRAKLLFGLTTRNNRGGRGRIMLRRTRSYHSMWHYQTLISPNRPQEGKKRTIPDTQNWFLLLLLLFLASLSCSWFHWILDFCLFVCLETCQVWVRCRHQGQTEHQQEKRMSRGVIMAAILV